MSLAEKMAYKDHGTDCPAWVPHSVAGVTRDAIRWSNPTHPPKVGQVIAVTINGCGPAIVTGYFTQDGWLGVTNRLIDPPDWFLKQNGGNVTGHSFGAEIRPLEARDLGRIAAGVKAGRVLKMIWEAI
jgi:hypothetical protein